MGGTFVSDLLTKADLTRVLEIPESMKRRRFFVSLSLGKVGQMLPCELLKGSLRHGPP